MEEKKGPKRLTLDIPDEMHMGIKVLAAKSNITIRQWVTQVVYLALVKEHYYNQKE